ncbi:MAG: hypothetical protein JSV23_01165 [Promethearchaeota archaeon]|nr:MAG: hypothetical protein JSV23_01165 [Candidatus Lokiarchaeota archaeon]
MSEIIICPACGFSFRYQNTKIEKNRIVCPMCGQKFTIPNFRPFTPSEFDKKLV